MLDNNIKKYFELSYNFYYKNKKNRNKIININNEYNITKKRGKYIFITFADSFNHNKLGLKRINNMKKLKNNLQKNNKYIDEIIIYNLNNIEIEFKKKNKSLFSSERYFPWISKVYVINKKLKEINDNDILLWLDSDIRDIKEKGTCNLYSLCENSEHGIVGFHNNFWLEKFFTKKELFDYMGFKSNIYYDTQQAYGGVLLLKKNNFTLKFINEWITIGENTDLFDNNIRCKQHPEFITHKNDQSILSLLLKKYNIKTFPLPLIGMDQNDIIALHAGYFNNNNSLPLLWEPCWHNVTIEEMYNSCNKKFNKFNKYKIIPKDCLYISLKYLTKN